ncbi:hypothetical protein MKW94_022851 [Papaver nudicaule]|uniref:Leucine-rich repeat-containing N-terminal plant-type domain-containing protein n=1 Tax=Papaver nudicaule TaxID=74823 RepID=A0AA42APV6_PAPNU|nr:hypothetical protein [Papaver nudicaule]
MATKLYLRISITTYLISAVLFLQAFALTDPSDVTVLRDMYMSLNQPPQLVGWNLRGGDPCEEAWKGISCSGSSVITIKLNGLDLSGSLGGNLFNLLHLKQLDLSHNYIEGEIPLSLPPNATHIDLSFNNFNNNNLSLESMKYLEHLNLSHNSISGPLGNVFTGFPNLKQMDLSHNSFTGNLPSSFETLSNLNQLFLQRNGFTGSVGILVHLPLHDLDIHMNYFNAVPSALLHLLPKPKLRVFNVAKRAELKFGSSIYRNCPPFPMDEENLWPVGTKIVNGRPVVPESYYSQMQARKAKCEIQSSLITR